MTSLRIVLLTQYPSAFASIRAGLVGTEHQIISVITTSRDKLSGQLSQLFQRQTRRMVESCPAGTPLCETHSVRQLRELLHRAEPDLLICRGFPWLVPPDLLGIPKLGSVNIHPSLLPRYRGPLPVHWAVRNADPTVGVSVHWMSDGFDTGAVLARGQVPVGAQVSRLWSSIDLMAARQLRKALPAIIAQRPGEAQDEHLASYAGFMEPEFATIDWSAPAVAIHNQVRTWELGLPGTGPIAWLDGQRVRVLRTSLTGGAGRRVRCGVGELWIDEYEPAPPVSGQPPT
jgi:methionyl-tRNA formyltransferase